jgi:hypothetical protein
MLSFMKGALTGATRAMTFVPKVGKIPEDPRFTGHHGPLKTAAFGMA